MNKNKNCTRAQVSQFSRVLTNHLPDITKPTNVASKFRSTPDRRNKEKQQLQAEEVFDLLVLIIAAAGGRNRQRWPRIKLRSISH